MAWGRCAFRVYFIFVARPRAPESSASAAPSYAAYSRGRHPSPRTLVTDGLGRKTFSAGTRQPAPGFPGAGSHWTWKSGGAQRNLYHDAPAAPGPSSPRCGCLSTWKLQDAGTHWARHEMCRYSSRPVHRCGKKPNRRGALQMEARLVEGSAGDLVPFTVYVL